MKLVVPDVEVRQSPEAREVWKPRDVVVRQVQLCDRYSSQFKNNYFAEM